MQYLFLNYQFVNNKLLSLHLIYSRMSSTPFQQQLSKRFHRLNRIDIHPYQFKSVEYKTRQVNYKVPVEKTSIQMVPYLKRHKVPVEKVVIDYLPVSQQATHRQRITRVKSWDCLPSFDHPVVENIQKYFQAEQRANELKTKTREQIGLFPQNKYCRFGQVFRDKYLNQETMYYLNALSPGKQFDFKEEREKRRSYYGSRERESTTEGEHEKYETSVDFDKNEQTTIGRSTLFSQYHRGR